jgi:hypothetical protein
MASMDDLLAQLKAEFEQKQSNSSQVCQPESHRQSTDDLLAEIQTQFEQSAAQSDCAMNRNPDDSHLDDLLNAAKAELSAPPGNRDNTDKALEAFKAESRPHQPGCDRNRTDEALEAFKPQSATQSKAPTDNELESLKNQFAQKVKANNSPPPQASAATDRVLAQLKQEYKQQKQDVDAQLHNTEDIVRQERVAEQRRQQRRKALQRKAEAWLKELDIQSDEGLWFEEFAYSYDSRLAAAMDYLQALEETR